MSEYTVSDIEKLLMNSSMIKYLEDEDCKDIEVENVYGDINNYVGYSVYAVSSPIQVGDDYLEIPNLFKFAVFSKENIINILKSDKAKLCNFIQDAIKEDGSIRDIEKNAHKSVLEAATEIFNISNLKKCIKEIYKDRYYDYLNDSSKSINNFREDTDGYVESFLRFLSETPHFKKYKLSRYLKDYLDNVYDKSWNFEISKDEFEDLGNEIDELAKSLGVKLNNEEEISLDGLDIVDEDLEDKVDCELLIEALLKIINHIVNNFPSFVDSLQEDTLEGVADILCTFYYMNTSVTSNSLFVNYLIKTTITGMVGNYWYYPTKKFKIEELINFNKLIEYLGVWKSIDALFNEVTSARTNSSKISSLAHKGLRFIKYIIRVDFNDTDTVPVTMCKLSDDLMVILTHILVVKKKLHKLLNLKLI